MPLDNRVPIMTPVEQKMRPEAALEVAKMQEARQHSNSGSRMDKTYVSNFLKEIDEI